MRQFVTYSGRHKAVLLVLLCLGIGTCDKQVVAPTPLIPPTINTSSLPDAILGESYTQTLSANGGDGNYNWTHTGQLPEGLSLSSGGMISGTPTSVGNSTFTVEVTSVGLKDSRQLALEVVYASPAITTTELRTGTIGQSYADTLKATGGDGSYAWSIIGGELPPGITLSPSGIFRGRARTPGEWALSIQVSSVNLATQKSLTLYTEHPDVAILTTDLPAAEVEVAYNRSLTAQGGDGEYTWSIASGALPQGLSLSAAGQITGTPTSTDTTTFVVGVTSGERSADAVFNMSVVAGPLEITTSSLPAGEVGTSYEETLEATGGDGTNYTWSVDPSLGTLPLGLGLSNSGSITGTPIGSGTSYFTVLVESANQIANQSLAITIVDSLSISTDSLPDATVGQLYSQVLSAAGGEGSGSYTWTIGAGILPAGLSLSTAGAITGTPTSGGTNSFLVTVTSAGISTSTTFTITVNNSLSISTSVLSNGVVGSTYEQTLGATGGDGSYSWSMLSGSLPGGLSLSSAGVISGIPTAAGAISFTVQVTSGGQTASKSLSITVAEGLTITTNTIPNANVGSAYSQALLAQAGDGTYSWSLSDGTPPAGLSLSSAGVISGTPTASGTSSFTVQVSSAGQTATKALSITVYEGLSIVTSILRHPEAGQSYTDTLEAVGGDGSYTWSLHSGQLPAGLSFSAAGILSGTPRFSIKQAPNGAETWSPGFKVSSAGLTHNKNIAIIVLPLLQITGNTSISTGVVGNPYDHTLTATGGAGHDPQAGLFYSWSYESGTLPTELSVSTEGVISGTPTTAGTFELTVKVTSGYPAAAELISTDRTFNLTVNGVVSVTTSSLANGMVNVPYSQSLTATGGDSSYNWFLASGALPAGLSLASSGVISGTPTATDTTTFTVSVVSATDTASATLSISVVEEDKNSIPFGTTLTGLSGNAGFVTWSTEVPESTSLLIVDLGGPGGYPNNYVDLYVAEGSIVGTTSGQYDCRDTDFPGLCLIQNPAAGRWSILIEADVGYTDLSLSINPEPQPISFGSTITGLSGNAGHPIWTTEVPAGTSSLVVEVGGPGGYPNDYVDLYIAEGSSVGTGSGQYDCRDTNFPGRCVIQNPTAGAWSILLEADVGYTDLSLSINPEPQTISFGGTLTQSGGAGHPVWTTEVPAGTSSLVVEIGGPGGYPNNYVDLYIAEGSSVGTGSGQYDCRDTNFPGRCLIENPGAGTWSIMLEADVGYTDLILSINPEPQTISFGSTVTQSGGAGHPVWTVDVPPGSSSMIIETGGPVGYPNAYVDLYVARGSSVGTASGEYLCRDTAHPGRCVIQYPSSGTWSIMLEADAGYTNLSLSVTGASGAWQSINTHSIHSCGVLSEGEAVCWGENDSGQLGDGTTTPTTTTRWVTGNVTWKPFSDMGTASVVSGGRHSCGVSDSGDAYCWGRNDVGQLGNGSTSNSSTPVLVSGGLKWRVISAGTGHTCGVTTAEALYCWGWNNHGQLGDGTTTNRSTPVLVSGGLRMRFISAGGQHTCGNTFNSLGGEIYCWGKNDHSQLGDGTTTDRSTPVNVSSGLSWGSIETSEFHTCAVTIHSTAGAGQAYCWGRNDQGQLGNGTTARRDRPTLVSGGLGFASISAGSFHTCAVDSPSQALYCWGLNNHGQLADQTTTNSLTPKEVGTWTVWALVTGGESHTCAVTTIGAAYCWGRDDYGQSGEGVGIDTLGPTRIYPPSRRGS